MSTPNTSPGAEPSQGQRFIWGFLSSDDSVHEPEQPYSCHPHDRPGERLGWQLDLRQCGTHFGLSGVLLKWGLGLLGALSLFGDLCWNSALLQRAVEQTAAFVKLDQVFRLVGPLSSTYMSDSRDNKCCLRQDAAREQEEINALRQQEPPHIGVCWACCTEL